MITLLTIIEHLGTLGVVVQGLLKVGRPVGQVVLGEVSLPAQVVPGVLQHEQLVALHTVYLCIFCIFFTLCKESQPQQLRYLTQTNYACWDFSCFRNPPNSSTSDSSL